MRGFLRGKPVPQGLVYSEEGPTGVVGDDIGRIPQFQIFTLTRVENESQEAFESRFDALIDILIQDDR
jgi:hypothetical protein